MILEKDWIISYESKTEYSYMIDGDTNGKWLHMRINDEFEPNTSYDVSMSEMDTKNTRTIDTSSIKSFPKTAQGFNEATAYFESLIQQNSKKQESKAETAPLSPIGLMCNPNIYGDTPSDTWEFEMMDGRKQLIGTDYFTVDNNVLTFQTEATVFNINESFYVDKIPNNDECLALYPMGDLDQTGGKSIEMNLNSDADNPLRQVPSTEPAKNEFASEMLKIKQRFAKYYKFETYDALINYFGTVNALFDEIRSYNQSEQRALFDFVTQGTEFDINKIKELIG